MKRGTKVLLTGAGLLAVHLIFREIRKKEPVIKVVDHIPGNFNGLALPPFGVYVTTPNANNQELIDHELIHWKQYQRMGLIPFYYNYLRDYLIHGYDLHPMEQEARANESNFCRTNYTECIRSGQAKTAFNPDFRKSVT